MSYDLLHGDDSVHLAHYGAKGMKWGVRKDDESGGSVRREATTARAATTATTKVAAAKKAGGSASGEKESKKGTSEEVYSAAFAKALGDPPITPEKIAAATKAAEKAVEDADLDEDGEGKGKGEEEKKKGGAGPKDLDAEKKKKEEKKRAKIAKDRAANAVLAEEMFTGMDAELSGKTKRTPETLKREALIVVSMLKMVAHDKKTFETLQSIGSRSNAESKGGERRSAEQLKTDAAFIKKLSERFTKEADFIGNFGKKDQDKVKHEKQEWQISYDLLHGDESVYLAHYGTKGMRWGVRKKVGNLGRAIKEQHAKDVAHARDRDVKMLRGLGMHKSADAVAANKSAGHALLGKNLKAAITSPRGKKMITIGAVVAVGTVLGVAGWDWQSDSTIKLRY